MAKNKEKKAGKRMKKKELIAALMDFFHSKPDEVLSLKYKVGGQAVLGRQ